MPGTIPQLAAAAQAAHRRRDWQAALALWAELRAHAPDRVDGYTSGATALRLSGRSDEADALLAEAERRFPADATVLMALGQQAQRIRDWQKAATYWQSACVAAPDSSRTHVGYAQALRAAHRFEEAEMVMAAAMQHFPDNADVALSHAAAAAGREDWDEAERRWAAVCAGFPDLPAAYLGHARFRLGRGQTDQARSVADRAERHFPNDREVQAIQARIAKAQGRWPAVQQRWEAVLRLDPGDQDAHVGLVEALTEAGDFDTADTRLDAASALVDVSPSAAWVVANLATRRGDLQTAQRLWLEAIRRFPQDKRMLHGLMNTQLRLTDRQIAGNPADDTENEADHGPSARPDEASLDTPEKRRLNQIFGCFQSIGDSCEFGIVQREFGVEPISLLRWTTMPLPNLIQALAHRFDGVGDPAQTGLHVTRGEYRTEDTRYVMRMHTFIRAHEVAPDILLPKLCARLRFLARRQIEDLTEGDRIFVFRSAGPRDDAAFAALHARLTDYARNRLLIVTREGPGFPAGTIRRWNETCLIGAIAGFSTRHPLVAGWQTLCEQAHAAFLSG